MLNQHIAGVQIAVNPMPISPTLIDLERSGTQVARVLVGPEHGGMSKTTIRTSYRDRQMQWVHYPWARSDWRHGTAHCRAVQAGKCRSPCLADLDQLGNGAALLNKISGTETTFLCQEFRRRVHRDLQLAHACRSNP